jgi:hypothetical protein
MAAIDDALAAVSYGAYPEPTPTGAERAIFAVSYGLLDTAPIFVEPTDVNRGIGRLGQHLTLD